MEEPHQQTSDMVQEQVNVLIGQMQQQIFAQMNKAREQNLEGVQAYVQAELEALCTRRQEERRQDLLEAQVAIGERLESAMQLEGERLEANMEEFRLEFVTPLGVLHSRMDDVQQ